LWSLVPLESRVAAAPSPLALTKSTKNEAELAGMKRAHVRDGAAVVEFLSWLFEEARVKIKSLVCSSMLLFEMERETIKRITVY